jgi:hypothetical protein
VLRLAPPVRRGDRSDRAGLDPPQSDEAVDDAVEVLVDVVVDELPAESPDAVDEEVSLAFESLEEDVDALPRLSVLKKPDPLNVTPTGVNTFLTGRTRPVSGCSYSVRVASWKPCWTSIVSPVSTNL